MRAFGAQVQNGNGMRLAFISRSIGMRSIASKRWEPEGASTSIILPSREKEGTWAIRCHCLIQVLPGGAKETKRSKSTERISLLTLALERKATTAMHGVAPRLSRVLSFGSRSATEAATGTVRALRGQLPLEHAGGRPIPNFSPL